MTADEYERILCPTDADFRVWTADLFRRAAQRENARERRTRMETESGCVCARSENVVN